MGNTKSDPLSEKLYDSFIGDNDDEGRVCRDIPDAACDDQPAAFTRQLAAQTLTKFADALVSPRLVLAWMLSSLGAPALFISLLVPIRESMSLVPQLFIAKYLRERPLRKTFWALGAAGQAGALIGMVFAVMLLEGTLLGLAIITLLTAFSLCRGICSVSSKDVLGKTVSKSRRGRLNGLAASISGIAILGVALALILKMELGIAFDGNSTVFIMMLASAAALWMLSMTIYLGIPEVPGATEGGGSAIQEAIDNVKLLASDETLRAFVIARAMLISVGIAIPYLVILIQRQSSASTPNFGDLGVLMLAEGVAALVSGSFWGKWSDAASHYVMAVAGSLSVVLMASVVFIQLINPGVLGAAPIAGIIIFIAAVSHQGVRIGRKTYLVDIATGDNRARYTAVSNTVIGILVMMTGIFGLVDLAYGTVTVIVLLGTIGLLGIGLTLRLPPAE